MPKSGAKGGRGVTPPAYRDGMSARRAGRTGTRRACGRGLFALQEVLGDAGWVKALRLEGYAARTHEKPAMLQQALFAYAETL